MKYPFTNTASSPQVCTKGGNSEYGREDQPAVYKAINMRGGCGSDSKLGSLTSDGDISIVGEAAV